MPNKPTPNENSSDAAAKAKELIARARRRRRADQQAINITTKSRKSDKANVEPARAIITKAEADRAAAEEKRKQTNYRVKSEDDQLKKINWNWREFALGLMNGKENYKAYADAYDMNDVDRDKRSYRLAAAKSSRLLKNVNFRAFWNDLIEEQGFNNQVADTNMLRLMTDPDTPAATRRSVIRDYNELKGRIVKKQAFTDDDGISLFDKENTSFEIRVVRKGE